MYMYSVKACCISDGSRCLSADEVNKVIRRTFPFAFDSANEHACRAETVGFECAVLLLAMAGVCVRVCPSALNGRVMERFWPVSKLESHQGGLASCSNTDTTTYHPYTSQASPIMKLIRYVLI